MPDSNKPTSARTAPNYWRLLRSCLIAAVVIYFAWDYSYLIPRQIGNSWGAHSPDPKHPYYVPIVSVVRDLSSNTVLRPEDLKLSRLYLSQGFVDPPTSAPMESIESCVGKKLRFAVYKNQALSLHDFGSFGKTDLRGVICIKYVLKEEAFTRENLIEGWIEMSKGDYDFTLTELPQALGRYSKTYNQPGWLVSEGDLMPKYFRPTVLKLGSKF
ncbi:MAG: SAF domain-containing protein [Candidatus Obscuribacter sp.]|jgi:hypothetical protein|nr:SAF domain-containing protein [Candidatus Obscuribacter sp.]MDQ5968062.1 hypothetical protein [Cyanobacteriota bacterium erpe_2018_sw_39hr_WHONDRS-SW48-000098_B_bin.30]MBL0187699.1 SAF domain-containing protein [Candidatus Obscuribacter sp.]MBP6348491.1 SAF domain-containing protein [Candidatus Obscuribacter sp.]MBP6591918.1 SAF domain-containing protein [Candidatus Obscuribacter sp.]